MVKEQLKAISVLRNSTLYGSRMGSGFVLHNVTLFDCNSVRVS